MKLEFIKIMSRILEIVWKFSAGWCYVRRLMCFFSLFIGAKSCISRQSWLWDTMSLESSFRVCFFPPQFAPMKWRIPNRHFVVAVCRTINSKISHCTRTVNDVPERKNLISPVFNEEELICQNDWSAPQSSERDDVAYTLCERNVRNHKDSKI